MSVNETTVSNIIGLVKPRMNSIINMTFVKKPRGGLFPALLPIIVGEETMSALHFTVTPGNV